MQKKAKTIKIKPKQKSKNIKKGINNKLMKPMKLHKIFTALILLLFIQNSFALTESTEIQIESNGLTKIMHSIELTEETQTTIELLAVPTELSVSCFQDLTPAECKYELNNKTLSLTNLNEINSIQINYSSDSLTNKTGKNWAINIPYASNTEEIKLIFPEESKITNFLPLASVYFNGTNMIVSWQKRNLIEGTGTASTQYSFEMPKQKENDLLIPLIALIIIVSITVLIYFKRKKLIPSPLTSSSASQNTASNEQQELMKTLPEKEKQIINMVLEEDGLTQKKLMQKTALPKATLSRTLKSLEQKQFLTIAQDGYTNRIYLSEWFKGKT
ncbi:MAG: winged helix-turn-helix transcriptional regulator [Candidatus Diapherotrites archaeon]